MMRQYELVERVRRYNPQTDEDLLNRAYVYAMQAHGHQKRASGDPYFSHPLEVAAILTELKLDDATIVAALLHDTIEDTDSTREEIDRIFGHDIGALVEGLTKLKKLDLVSKQAEQGENFRKLMLAIADDVRVLLVKLADRLHNMRTLGAMRDDKRKRIAKETLEIYAPLAGRMGMQGMRDELEDLSFRNLLPEAYSTITQRLEELRHRNGALILEIERELTEQLARRGIVAEVKGRQKRAFSVWSKMERKSLAFEQLSDIFGFRTLVDSLEDCYRVLGVVHTTWSMVPGRFKDYISTPKQNDYRSIHTTVVGPGRQRVELQIRSHEMHEIAEYGIAAHALYKDGRAGDVETLSSESQAYLWLRRTMEMFSDRDTPEEVLENTKLELFQDQVFCFSPKGKLIALPRGATPIDFAYAVHTNIGNSAIGVKVNGVVAPLFSPLQNGDEVEIIRAEGQKAPPPAWESMVATGKARAAIRRATKEAVREQYAGLGRQIVARAFERANKPYSEDRLAAALPRLARGSVDDVFSAVGRGEMVSGDVVKAVHPDFTEERKAPPAAPKNESGWFGLRKAASLVFKIPGVGSGAGAAPAQGGAAIPIRGLPSDMAVRFAPNGGAVPGDRIVGIVTPGEGITIYPIQSPALTAFDDQPERWLDVRWDIDESKRELYPAQLFVRGLNEPGALGIIATTIGEANGNIDNVSFSNTSPDFRDITIDLEVLDLKHLTTIIQQLRGKSVVNKVERVNG
jgi:guanosine-3',5'-bis(diphosphate) 3'-pyrophosphohydrolase